MQYVLVKWWQDEYHQPVVCGTQATSGLMNSTHGYYFMQRWHLVFCLSSHQSHKFISLICLLGSPDKWINYKLDHVGNLLYTHYNVLWSLLMPYQNKKPPLKILCIPPPLGQIVNMFWYYEVYESLSPPYHFPIPYNH